MLSGLEMIDCAPYLDPFASSSGGGAIESKGCLTLKNSVIRNCITNDSNSRNNGGSAIYFSGSYLVMEDCTIDSNHAGDQIPNDARAASPGGAISMTGAIVIFTRCTISNNSSGVGTFGGAGGGIYISGGFTRLEQCTVTGNQAASGTTKSHGEGGGIYSSGEVHFISGTVADDEVGTGGRGYGGGISMLGGRLVLENSIVADNRNLGSPVTGKDLSGNNLIFRGVNLIGEETFPEVDALEMGSPNSAGQFVGPLGSPISAMLGPLRDNGGLTPTRLPLEGSLAIDPPAGDVASEFESDQRGFTRIFNGILDIGATEAPDWVAIRIAANQRELLRRKIQKLRRKARTLDRRGK